MNNTELTNALWAIESRTKEILASPHGSAGTSRLQGALDDSRDLQVEWDTYRAMHMDYCLRCAANKGALAYEEYKELIEQLWAAMRTEPDPREPVVHSRRGTRLHKGFRVALLVTAAIAIVLMVIAAVAMVFEVSFGTLLRTVAVVTAVATVLLGIIWTICGGDTGPELK